jgi:hypothetical protein
MEMMTMNNDDPVPVNINPARLAAIQQTGEVVHGKEEFGESLAALHEMNPNGLDPVEVQRMMQDPNAATEFFKKGRDAFIKLADENPMINAQLVARRQAEREKFRKMRGR